MLFYFWLALCALLGWKQADGLGLVSGLLIAFTVSVVWGLDRRISRYFALAILLAWVIGGFENGWWISIVGFVVTLGVLRLIRLIKLAHPKQADAAYYSQLHNQMRENNRLSIQEEVSDSATEVDLNDISEAASYVVACIPVFIDNSLDRTLKMLAKEFPNSLSKKEAKTGRLLRPYLFLTMIAYVEVRLMHLASMRKFDCSSYLSVIESGVSSMLSSGQSIYESNQFLRAARAHIETRLRINMSGSQAACEYLLTTILTSHPTNEELNRVVPLMMKSIIWPVTWWDHKDKQRLIAIGMAESMGYKHKFDSVGQANYIKQIQDLIS